MYENVGEKLKLISKIVAGVTMGSSVILGLIALAGLSENSGVGWFVFLLFAFLTFLGWLSGIGIYAFGHLIVTQDEILKEQKNVVRELKKMNSNKTDNDDQENEYVEDIVLPKL